MTDYLSYTFADTKEFVSTYDELPLWSAPFGALLLKHIEYKCDLTVLDIGFGTGFPLLEIASRLGNTCTLYGVDVWENAANRAAEKIKNYGLQNVTLIEGSADQISLNNSTIDLIVSNLGINNFEHPEDVFDECYRLLKPGGRLILTTNVLGHWREFYEVFEQTLQQLDRPDDVAKLQEDQLRRGNIKSVSKLFIDCGLNVTKIIEEAFEMKFADGSAFLNHHFIKLGWLNSWKAFFPDQDLVYIFSALEKNLNEYAAKHNGLTLTVPMALVEGIRA